MATITPSYPAPSGMANMTNLRQVKWALSGASDVGTAEMLGNFADRTITVTGTWSSATLLVEGSNDNVTFVTMTDPQGNALSKTADFIEAMLENPLYVRVSTSGGGAGTTLTAIITAKS